jgi:hypothetical protein
LCGYEKGSPASPIGEAGQSSGGVLLSRGYPSIMGAEELDDRVRDGNGYDLLAVTTRRKGLKYEFGRLRMMARVIADGAITTRGIEELRERMGILERDGL